MTTQQVLINAKELLVTKGWITNNYKSSKGYDLTGALSYGTPGQGPEARKPFYAALEVLIPLTGDTEVGHYFKLEKWNDKKGRKLEEVLKLLDQAIIISIQSETNTGDEGNK
jgi:hypothetical protein